MKAVVQNSLGEPVSALTLVDIDEPANLAADEVRIRVSLTSVHHGDLHLIRGTTGIPQEPGHIRRGTEAVGIVDAVGADVADLKAGTRVVGFPAIGAWAQTVVVSAHAAIAVPDDVSDEVAAQLFINYVAACMVLRGLRTSVSDSVLREGAVVVTGASTVVARILLFLLSEAGLHPIGLARSGESADRVSAELAGPPVTATAAFDWKAKLMASAAGRPIVGIVDCVAGSLLGDLAPLLADDCVIITYGSLDGGPVGMSGFDIIDHQFVIRGVTFARWFTEVPPSEQAADIAAAIALSTRAPSLFAFPKIFALEDFEQAIAAVEQPNRRGFVLLKPNR